MKIVSLLLLILLSSCSKTKIIDLENIDANFNVSEYYKNKLQQVNGEVDCLSKNYTIDTLCFFNSNGRFVENKYITIKHDWMVKDEDFSNVFGYEYHPFCWNENNEILAFFNTVNFSKINMIATTNGKLAGLYVDNEIKDEKKVLDLKVYLDQKYGTGKIVEGSFNKKAFKWESNQFIIQIPIGKTTSFDQLETFTFFMINKNFTDEISLLKTGEWIELIIK